MIEKLKNLLFVFLSITTSVLLCQQTDLETTLSSTIKETSGLIIINNKLITHNDSGSKAELYEFNKKGEVTKTTKINASNVDWEDICYDDKYIYIGDFGNNNGNRENLKIYRISKLDYINGLNNLSSEIIGFNYPEQIDRLYAPYQHNFDCETIISINNNLYIFTKNWKNLKTDIYELPKTPGIYKAKKIGTINVNGLITGGDYNIKTKKIVLLGYYFDTNFIIEITDFTPSNFSKIQFEKFEFEISENISTQTEAISFLNENSFLITAEEYKNNKQCLLSLKRQSLNIKDEILIQNQTSIYPNPTSKEIKIKNKDFLLALIYNIEGQLMLSSKKKNFSLKGLAKGTYILHIKNKNNKNVFKRVIKI